MKKLNIIFMVMIVVGMITFLIISLYSYNRKMDLADIHGVIVDYKKGSKGGATIHYKTHENKVDSFHAQFFSGFQKDHHIKIGDSISKSSKEYCFLFYQKDSMGNYKYCCCYDYR